MDYEHVKEGGFFSKYQMSLEQMDRKNCENEAVLQEIKQPIRFCFSSSSYREICSKPKTQCPTKVRLPARF